MSTSRVAIVTGGSRGIGEAIVSKLKEQDWCKAAVAVSRTGGDIHGDVSNEGNVRDIVRIVLDRYGSIDILVNCAGAVTTTPVEEMSVDEWNRIIGVNLTGAFLMCKHVLPIMSDNGWGRIINIGSIAGISRSMTASVAYTCSKYGMVGLTKQLSPEYADRGITINCLCPSQTETEMLIANTDEFFRESISRNNPSKRLAKPADIADAAIFLCSEGASYINGTAIPITGGMI